MLAFESVGSADKPAIVFLHGLGVSRWMWSEQIQMLSKDYRCLAIDLPGSGDSHTLRWPGFDGAADQIAKLIRSETGKAHVVGLSLGGYVTLRLLERHPEIISRAVVSGITIIPLMPKPVMSVLSWLMAQSVGWKWVGRLSARMMRLDPDATTLYLRDMARLDAGDVRRIYNEINEERALRLTGDSAKSLLAIAGTREAAAIKKSLAILAQSDDGIATGWVDNLGHIWVADDVALFTRVLQEWIEDHATSLRPASSGEDPLAIHA
ncbi:MAG: alpha/beta hydrolase [Hyphomicrobiales bacterium]|nr:alpha/beta hydrolase [Hyphomicrobiales bacterium]